MLTARIQTAVSLIYPSRCLGCGGLVESDFGLCAVCWGEMRFVTGTVCEGCGVPLPGEADGFRQECDSCLHHSRPWSQGRSALLYEGQGRKLVLALKHGDRTEIAGPAGNWLYRAAQPLLQGNPLVCPVPLHWTRLLKRKYNQSALLAEVLARKSGLQQCPDLLRRVCRTPALEGKTRDQRYSLLGEAIKIGPNWQKKVIGQTVLIVDDVMTSGATLSACTDACLKAGAQDVRVAVLARVTQV
ncbi:double zinc ribbon domain-containing protein [Leisingera sp. S232]|uniref:ComF family protein n=1 Tax=Leisingera sp. S232 TaxID=3415132 RepID=UPI00086F47C7|nr:amidophosphoribosyltransferase [Rhodobacteraceae bacterium (ex Bugula neritina AB1)]